MLELLGEMRGRGESPFSAALPGTCSFMRSLARARQCTLCCLPQPGDRSVCVAGCAAETSQLCLLGDSVAPEDTQSRVLLWGSVSPSLGLPSAGTRTFAGLCAPATFAEHGPRSHERALWMVVTWPCPPDTSPLPAAAASELPSVPLPGGLEGAEPVCLAR